MTQPPVIGSSVGHSMTIQSVFHTVTVLEPRCTEDAQADEKGGREREGTPPQTCPIPPLLAELLPFTSAGMNPSRTGSAKRGKLAFGRLAVSANWSPA